MPHRFVHPLLKNETDKKRWPYVTNENGLEIEGKPAHQESSNLQVEMFSWLNCVRSWSICRPSIVEWRKGCPRMSNTVCTHRKSYVKICRETASITQINRYENGLDWTYILWFFFSFFFSCFVEEYVLTLWLNRWSGQSGAKRRKRSLLEEHSMPLTDLVSKCHFRSINIYRKNSVNRWALVALRKLAFRPQHIYVRFQSPFDLSLRKWHQNAANIS